MKTHREMAIAARDFLLGTVVDESVGNIRVEEIWQKDSKGIYIVTLSYKVAANFPFNEANILKDFEINSLTGDVLSMKIHPV